MLLGRSTHKSSVTTILRIKAALGRALKLPDDWVLTLVELACHEKGCPPVETAIGLLRPHGPRLEHKLQKSAAEIGTEDLVELCRAWGFEADLDVLKQMQERE